MIIFNNLRFDWNQNTKLTFPDLEVQEGEHLFVEGPSGSGKTTLLNLLAGIFLPSTGRIQVLEEDFSTLKPHQRDLFRANHLGIIFQQFNLLPYLSVLENVLLTTSFSKRRKEQSTPIITTANHLLDELKIEENLRDKNVTDLSVGQQQRIAVARALIGKPEIIIADEPTSALDTNTRDTFLDLLFNEADQQQSTIVFVSHDISLRKRFKKTISLI